MSVIILDQKALSADFMATAKRVENYGKGKAVTEQFNSGDSIPKIIFSTKLRTSTGIKFGYNSSKFTWQGWLEGDRTFLSVDQNAILEEGKSNA
ncbi:MAG TPA: hypothetical protein VGF75_01295 [Candidatus Saccharimonadales bacterium]